MYTLHYVVCENFRSSGCTESRISGKHVALDAGHGRLDSGCDLSCFTNCITLTVSAMLLGTKTLPVDIFNGILFQFLSFTSSS